MTAHTPVFCQRCYREGHYSDDCPERNEAAERLRAEWTSPEWADVLRKPSLDYMLYAALAAERRATALVEQDKDGAWGLTKRGARILNAAGTHDGKVDVIDLLHALAVDEEEAAR